MQKPNPDRQMSIGAASFKAAGFVNYDNMTSPTKSRQTPAIDGGLQSPSSSVPAPVQSRVVFQGGLGGLPNVNGEK